MQILMATFGPLALALILVGIGMLGSGLEPKMRSRLEAFFLIPVAVLGFIAFLVWNVMLRNVVFILGAGLAVLTHGLPWLAAKSGPPRRK